MPLHLLQIAKKLAHDAGKLALEYQAKGFKVESKGGFDLVTEADKACEELILKTIQGNFPDHAILTEETGAIGDPKAEYKWIVDPIDGTLNFAHGLPFYAVSIAIVYKGLPIIGVVEAPALGEVFWAKKGHGAFMGNKPIQVARTNDLSKALVGTCYPYDRASDGFAMTHTLVREISQSVQGFREIGSAALEGAYIAAGRLDAGIHYSLKPWDIAAAKIIIEEAGGMVTDLDGNMLSPKNGRMLASNGILHQDVMNLVKSTGGDKVL